MNAVDAGRRTGGVDSVVGGSSRKGGRDRARGVAAILCGRGVGDCTRGRTAEWMDMRLNTDGNAGLVPLGIVWILIVGNGLWLHILGARHL